MEINKSFTTGGYYISYNNKDSCDITISQLLNLTLEEYQNILIQNGGIYLSYNDDEIYFNNREDIQKAINALEPYLIMSKLVE